MVDLFQNKDFVSHSGVSLSWKIDADALTDTDLAVLAKQVAEKLQFSKVIGIPRGGLRFADALRPYETYGPVLLVDDVLTTGGSMEQAKTGFYDPIGVVIFARGACPDWIKPIFRVGSWLT